MIYCYLVISTSCTCRWVLVHFSPGLKGNSLKNLGLWGYSECTVYTECTAVVPFNNIYFSKVFGRHTCPFLGPLVPLFWISGDVSSGFQSQSGFCLIRIVEANVMYIPWDPPLVLHELTSWRPTCHQSCPHILLQRRGCRDSNSCYQNICESDALPIELNRDGLLLIILIINNNWCPSLMATAHRA